MHVTHLKIIIELISRSRSDDRFIFHFPQLDALLRRKLRL